MDWQESLTAFPDRLNPVFVRDLRKALRAPLVVTSLLILQVSVLTMTGVELAVLHFSGTGGVVAFFSGALPILLGIGFGLLLPLTAIGALQPELGSARNIELLLGANLTRWQIVRGKWVSMVALSALLLSSVAPYLVIRYFLGSIDLLSAGTMLFSTLMAGAVMSAAVIGASGFQSYIARSLAILFFGLMFLLCSAMSAGGAAPSLVTGPTSLFFLTRIVIGAVLVMLALQVGRAQLKLFATLESPSAAAAIFVITLVFPFLLGIAGSAGGAVAMLLLSLFWLALAFLIDRQRRPSYR